MSHPILQCTCGNDAFCVSVAIPVTIVVGPTETTLDIHRPGHRPDYDSWPHAWCQTAMPQLATTPTRLLNMPS